MEKTPEIAIIYNEKLSNELFDNFREIINHEHLSVVVESQPDEDSLFACPEWFIPTLVAAFIGKPYFDGFLKEMGKDHYHVLKDSLSELVGKLMSRKDIEPTFIGTKGKLSHNNPFSGIFSIYAEAYEGNRFKLLIPKSASPEEYNTIVHCFLAFLEDYHSGRISLKDIGFNSTHKLPSGQIFVCVNLKKEAIEWLDERAFR